MTELAKVLSYLSKPSRISDHGTSCCTNAKRWLRAFDRSAAFSDGNWRPPTWVRERYSWGPLRWPIAWCQIPDSEVLDCGGLAGIATEVFRMRRESASQIQLVLRYSPLVAAGWRVMWEHAGESGDWVRGGLCYHEATAVARAGRVSIWDPTENRWIEPDVATTASASGVVALNLAEPAIWSGANTVWGSTELHVGHWTVLDGVEATMGVEEVDARQRILTP